MRGRPVPEPILEIENLSISFFTRAGEIPAVMDFSARVMPGEALGLVDYNFRWHVGDRVAILSDGYYDSFADGLRTISLGTLLSRPGRTEVYLGIRSLEGPISSNIVTASARYRMSEKWIASASTSYDLGPTGNIGQTMGLTRIGESALLHFGFNVDASRDNVGVTLALEPRFLPSRCSNIGGVPIAPAQRISTLHSMSSIGPADPLVAGLTRFPLTIQR